MIKKLRLKFILMSMALIALIMLIIFVAVYSMMRSVIVERSESVLDLAEEMLRVGVYFKNKLPESRPVSTQAGESGGDEFERNDPDMLESFGSDYKKYRKWLFEHVITVIYSNDGTINKVDMPIDTPGLGDLKGKNISLISPEGESFVLIDEYPFRYRNIKLDGYGVMLLISSISEAHELDSLLSVLTTVGAIAFILILILCIMMSGRIIKPTEILWEKQKMFVADASHELKTPLTVISATVDVVKQNPNATVAEQKKWLDNIDAEISDMQKLINDMLSLARLDSGVDRSKIYGRINLSDVVTEAGLVCESRVIEIGTEIDLEVDSDICINGDEREIKQVVMILLDNAIKNTPVGGKITLSLSKQKGEAVIVCHNTGDGIPESDLKAVFDRFYRSDQSRARISGGSGLGLAIAKGITEAHRGRIYAESEYHKYAKFTVRLPLYKH